MLQVIRSLLHSFFHAAVEDEILAVLEIFYEFRLEVGQEHTFRSHDIQSTQGNTGLDAFQCGVQVQLAVAEDQGISSIYFTGPREMTWSLRECGFVV